MRKLLLLYICFGLSALSYADGNKTSPRIDKPKTRLYEQAGLGLYDGSFEATGKVQADRYFEFVNQSTPTIPASNHAREWFDNTRQKLCVRFDDGTSSCLGPGTSGGGGTLSGATDPAYYNSGANTVSVSRISLSTWTIGILSISTQTNLTASGAAVLSGSNIGVGTIDISTGTNLTASGSAVLNGDNIGVGSISLSTGVVGILPEANTVHTFTSSITLVGVNLLANNGVIESSGGFRVLAQKSVAFFDPANANSITLQAPISLTSYNMQLPSSQGALNSILRNDGTGSLTWVSSNTLGGKINIGTSNQLSYYVATGDSLSPTGDNLKWTPTTGTLQLGHTNNTSPGEVYLGANSGISGQVTWGHTSGDATILRADDAGSDRIYHIPAVTDGAYMVMTEGAQNVNGNKTFTSSGSFTNASGVYTNYNISAGSITARNIASGTQCVQADSSGNLTGTGAACGSGSGNAVLSATQTWTGGNVYQGYTNHIGSTTVTDLNGTFIGLGRNRIINGDMVLDQRNEGTAKQINNAASFYGVDRYFGYGTASSGVFTTQRLSTGTAPSGFTYYTHINVLTAVGTPSASSFYFFAQYIEGYNVRDFNLGTSASKPFTLSFWARSNLASTFGGAFLNSAGDRTYPFQYTINTANTWQYITITSTGETSGTWVTNNGTGLGVLWDLGMGSTYQGSSGVWQNAKYTVTGSTRLVNSTANTLDITGVQIEVGATATSFEFTPWPLQLTQCQRYYEKSYDVGTTPGSADGASSTWLGWGAQRNTNTMEYTGSFKVNKRTAPTMTFYNASGTSGQMTFVNTANGVTNRAVTTIIAAPYNFQYQQTTAVEYYSEGNWTAEADF